MKRLIVTGTGIATICVAGVLAGFNQAQARTAQLTAPTKLVLKLADLAPDGKFKVVKSKSLSSAQAAQSGNMDAQILTKHGFVSSFEVTFERTGITSIKKFSGLLSVDHQLNSFTSASGAHAIYLAEIRGAEADKTLKSFKMKSFGKMGQESIGWHGQETISGLPITIDALIFRQGNYVSILAASGKAMTLGKEDSVVSTLSTIAQHRIAKSG